MNNFNQVMRKNYPKKWKNKSRGKERKTKMGFTNLSTNFTAQFIGQKNQDGSSIPLSK